MHAIYKYATIFSFSISLLLSGLEAWAAGNIEDFGTLMTASGLSSIQNYECGITFSSISNCILLLLTIPPTSTQKKKRITLKKQWWT